MNNTITADLKVLYSSKENRAKYGFGDTWFYHYKKENIIIRFDSAEYLLWEQRRRDLKFNDNSGLK